MNMAALVLLGSCVGKFFGFIHVVIIVGMIALYALSKSRLGRMVLDKLFMFFVGEEFTKLP